MTAMTEPLPLTIGDAARVLRSGALTAVELTSALLARIEAEDPRLGAFVTVCPETALEAATEADEMRAHGVEKGALQGIPLAIKDLIATRDAPTSANSAVQDPAWGKGVDASVVARLRAAGAVILGKATTSEFAMGPPDPAKGFLVPRNPWNTDHIAAGSSSGTGVAVAAGLALGGLGTDTGGSVRGPAAVNGHTGLKVTFGRVPKNGVVPLSASLDTVGPMARSAYDCALLLEVMAGHDPGDRDAGRVPVPSYPALLSGSVEGVRIGVATPYFFDLPELDAETRTAVLTAVGVLRDHGALVREVTVPYAKEARDASHLILAADAFAYHRSNLVHRWHDYGPGTRPMLARGAMYSAGDYAQAQRLRTAFGRGLSTVFDTVDVLVTPTMTGPAERFDEFDVEMLLLGPGFTGQWNLAGLPAVAVPCGFSVSGLPLSMQIVGRPYAEATVLNAADAYQRWTDWHLKVPPTAVSS
ncbi:amidase [Actinopolymorpha alba]|uniref:amidase n=1 Tax=Actinopolymorpha alba TaxID=533267 RepID=UPI000373E3D6|nr:amidase [Actinopolymorpha alba]